MATDLTVSLENRPGRLADLTQALGAAGVNIEGLAATTHGDSGEIHLLVEDADAAGAALSGAGIEVAAQTAVVVVDMSGREDTPGAVFAADDVAALRGAIG